MYNSEIENGRIPDYFTMVDDEGRILDTDGRPVPDWILKPASTVYPMSNRAHRPNRRRACEFIAVATHLERVFAFMNCSCHTEFDFGSGVMYIVVLAEAIDFLLQNTDDVLLLALADSITFSPKDTESIELRLAFSRFYDED